MIVVKLELWPDGDASRAQDLGKAIIANESDLADLSTYSVRLLKGAKYSSHPGTLYKSGTVQSFPRQDRRWGPWELLALALEATVGDRVEGLKRYVRAKVLPHAAPVVCTRCRGQIPAETYAAHWQTCTGAL